MTVCAAGLAVCEALAVFLAALRAFAGAFPFLALRLLAEKIVDDDIEVLFVFYYLLLGVFQTFILVVFTTKNSAVFLLIDLRLILRKRLEHGQLSFF